MTDLALSTMWAQQERFRGNVRGFVAIARDAGFQGIEVSHATDEAGLRECLSCGVLPVVSLHAPTPYTTTSRGRGNSSLNLAALDEDERAAAVAATLRTIDFARDAGVRFMVVHLGAVAGHAWNALKRLRGLYTAGAVGGEEAARVRDEAIAARAEAAPAHLVAARRSLAEIVAVARRHGIAVGLETRLSYPEIPSPDEALDLLAEYAPGEAGYWHEIDQHEPEASLAAAVGLLRAWGIAGEHVHGG